MEYSLQNPAASTLLDGVGSRIIFEGSICDAYPCWNEGTCVLLNKSSALYSCTCSPFFVGNHCQYNVLDLCLQGNCNASSSCSVKGFDINCPENLMAEFLTSCLTNVCLHGGRCVEGSHGHRCVCPQPYQGPFCQFEYAINSDWSLLEVGLLCLLAAMTIFTLAIICCSSNMGFYISVPAKRYSRWEEGDISDEEEEQEIALGDLKRSQLRLSQTSDTLVDEVEGSNSASSSNRYGVVNL